MTRSRTVGSMLGLVLAVSAVSAASAATVQVRVQDAQGKPLTDAVVYLESAAAKAQVKPVSGMEIEQVSKQFAPTVTVVPIGSLLQFPNRDTVRHHVYSFSPAKTFELKLYTGSPSSPVLFDRPGVVVLGCNIHDNMAAWVVVVETPFYGKSNETGTVAITNVAPGAYKLRAWHVSLPFGSAPFEHPVTVGSAEFSFAVVLKGAAP